MSNVNQTYALSRPMVDKLLETTLFFRRILMGDTWLLDDGGEPWKAPGPICALQDWERLNSDLADLRLEVTELKMAELPPRVIHRRKRARKVTAHKRFRNAS